MTGTHYRYIPYLQIFLLQKLSFRKSSFCYVQDIFFYPFPTQVGLADWCCLLPSEYSYTRDLYYYAVTGYPCSFGGWGVSRSPDFFLPTMELKWRKSYSLPYYSVLWSQSHKEPKLLAGAGVGSGSSFESAKVVNKNKNSY